MVRLRSLRLNSMSLVLVFMLNILSHTITGSSEQCCQDSTHCEIFRCTDDASSNAVVENDVDEVMMLQTMHSSKRSLSGEEDQHDTQQHQQQEQMPSLGGLGGATGGTPNWMGNMGNAANAIGSQAPAAIGGQVPVGGGQQVAANGDPYWSERKVTQTTIYKNTPPPTASQAKMLLTINSFISLILWGFGWAASVVGSFLGMSSIAIDVMGAVYGAAAAGNGR
eukprot:gnl/TRDRNA2_/TRDRNA2_182770_c0_seq1.p1 gnl/TRDRNA2_/TRDRNA2_182770_c0~~gnl/TRDRNA2_/TRDRNA2_182770_c0_seq1.p1  ORF type:complete len:223 (-),score=30.12 gnl/TRDRNA2_/TRDRNA2_182770_c0_seq1:35-703(-)